MILKLGYEQACAEGSLEGIRDDYALMLSLHEICTSVFSQLPASLAQYRLQPGDLIGNTVPIAMEAMVRVEVMSMLMVLILSHVQNSHTALRTSLSPLF